MARRKIIRIDQEMCNGCGVCIPNCPEGAIQMIDGKARLISDLFCDGLGACIGHCPQGAITIEEREAEPYDERRVIPNIVKQGANTILAHLKHLKDHGEEGYFKEAVAYLREKRIDVPLHGLTSAPGGGGCPGSRMVDRREKAPEAHPASGQSAESQLRQWPVQIMLVPERAPYLSGADLLIAADCVPFAYADFHAKLLRGRTLLVGCPKLDDLAFYKEKLARIFAHNDIRSVTYAHMEVPCCLGLIGVIRDSIAGSGKDIPFRDVTIAIDGSVRA